jgi:hypothetical protein
MNTDLGVWTYEDCAVVLIDYQKEMFEVIRSETDQALVARAPRSKGRQVSCSRQFRRRAAWR